MELQAQLIQLKDRAEEGSQRKGALQGEQTGLQNSLQLEQTELRTQEVGYSHAPGRMPRFGKFAAGIASKGRYRCL